MVDYVSVNAASAVLRIPEFRGLWQYGDGDSAGFDISGMELTVRTERIFI